MSISKGIRPLSVKDRTVELPASAARGLPRGAELKVDAVDYLVDVVLPTTVGTVILGLVERGARLRGPDPVDAERTERWDGPDTTLAELGEAADRLGWPDAPTRARR